MEKGRVQTSTLLKSFRVAVSVSRVRRIAITLEIHSFIPPPDLTPGGWRKSFVQCPFPLLTSYLEGELYCIRHHYT